VSDAQGIARVMEKNYGFASDELALMTCGRKKSDALFPNRENILKQFSGIPRGLDYLLVFFSGHGCGRRNPNGAHDVYLSLVTEEALSFSFLSEKIKEIAPMFTCLILDCCQSSSLPNKRGVATVLSQEDIESMEKCAREIQAVPRPRRSGQAPTTIFISACSPGQSAYEWQEKGHGVFTYHLLGTMEGSKNVTEWIGRIKDPVRTTVQTLFQKEQQPYIKFEGQGDFLFDPTPGFVGSVSPTWSHTTLATPSYSHTPHLAKGEHERAIDITIAKKFSPKERSWFNFFSGDELKEFLAEKGVQALDYTTSSITRIDNVGQLSKGITPKLANLSTEPFDLELLFSRLRTQDGKEIDLRVKVLCKITNSVSFLHRWKDRLDARNCIESSDIEERVKNNVLSHIVDLIANYTYRQLDTEHSLPTTAYHAELVHVLAPLGLELSEVKLPEYLCEEVTAQETLKKFRREYEMREERERITADYAEAAKTRRLQEEERRREIEHEHRLADQRRQSELEIEWDNIQLQQQERYLEFELKRVEVEDKIAFIRDQQEERERIKLERRSLEEQFKLCQQDQKDAIKLLQELEKAHRAGIETIVDLLREWRKTPAAPFAGSISDGVREWFKESTKRYDKVPIKVIEAVSRDIGRKANVLFIKQCLDFEFVSPKSGYITIFNFGTSGDFLLHVPNAYINVGQAKVTANQAYSIPGNELLPKVELQRNNLCYREEGPVGVEKLIVIVTPTPLIQAVDIFEASSNAPFVEVLPSRMEKLITDLDAMTDDAVALGALGFVVRD
jgi:hypothetical protein